MELQHNILQNVCGVKKSFTDPKAGAKALKESLLATTVPNFLLILDDLWEDPARPDMLQWLLPPQVAKTCSSKGSWVVVATRDSDNVTTLLGDNKHQEIPVSKRHEVVRIAHTIHMVEHVRASLMPEACTVGGAWFSIHGTAGSDPKL